MGFLRRAELSPAPLLQQLIILRDGQTWPGILSDGVFLPESLIKRDGASYGYIEGLNNAYLGNNEIPIGKSKYLLADAGMFVPEDEGDTAGKVHLIEGYGIAAQVSGKDMVHFTTQVIDTGPGISILMNSQPLCGAAAAFRAPFLMQRYPGIEHIDILDAYRIAGAHNSRDIMRVEDIFQYDDEVILSFVQYGGNPLFSFRSHS